MNWEAIGAIGEVIGAIAVVTTLIYLSVQLRQNTNTVQASIRQDVLSEDRNALYMLVEHPFLNQRTNLTKEQESQLAAFLIAFIRMRESHWLQYQSGMLDEATWKSYRTPLQTVIFSSEFGRTLWRYHSEKFLDQGFVGSINEWISGISFEDSDVVIPPMSKTIGQ